MATHPYKIFLLAAEGRLENEAELVQCVKDAGHPLVVFRDLDSLARELASNEEYHAISAVEAATIDPDDPVARGKFLFVREIYPLRENRRISVIWLAPPPPKPVYRGWSSDPSNCRISPPVDPDTLTNFIKRILNTSEEFMSWLEGPSSHYAGYRESCVIKPAREEDA